MISWRYFCESDHTVFTVSKLDPETFLLAVVINCPTCHKTINLITDDNFCIEPCNQIINLSAKELFRAANGLGLPDSEEVSVPRVNNLSKDSKILSVSLKQSTSGKTIIEEMIITPFVRKGLFQRNYTLHFGTSVQGAVIYKITTEEVC